MSAWQSHIASAGRPLILHDVAKQACLLTGHAMLSTKGFGDLLLAMWITP